MSSATDSAPALSPSPHCWGPHKASQRAVVKALQISKVVHTREPSSACSWLSRERDSMAFGHKEKGQDGASTSNLTSYLSSKTPHLAYLWAWSPLCPRGTEKTLCLSNSLFSWDHLCWTCRPSSPFQGPAGHQTVCQLGLHSAPPCLRQMAGSTARMVAASTFPVSGRSDGLSHIALPGSDSHWMPQGQGQLDRNHGGTCLLIWLLWSLFSQRPCRRGSPQTKSRKGDGLCLLAVHRGKEHKKALEGSVMKSVSFLVPCTCWSCHCILPRHALLLSWEFILYLINFNIKSHLVEDVRGSSGQSHVCGLYKGTSRRVIHSERVRKGQTQAAITFCGWLVATCVFSP